MKKKAYIIAYDISDGWRLSHMATLMESHGVRIQNSVFYSMLDESSLEKLYIRIMNIMDEKEDSVFIQPVCGNCINHLELLGRAKNYKIIQDNYLII